MNCSGPFWDRGRATSQALRRLLGSCSRGGDEGGVIARSLPRRHEEPCPVPWGSPFSDLVTLSDRPVDRRVGSGSCGVEGGALPLALSCRSRLPKLRRKTPCPPLSTPPAERPSKPWTAYLCAVPAAAGPARQRSPGTCTYTPCATRARARQLRAHHVVDQLFLFFRGRALKFVWEEGKQVGGLGNTPSFLPLLAGRKGFDRLMGIEPSRFRVHRIPCP